MALALAPAAAKAANIKEAVDELKRGVASGEVKSLDHPLVEEVVSQMNKARILSESKMGMDQIQAELSGSKMTP